MALEIRRDDQAIAAGAAPLALAEALLLATRLQRQTASPPLIAITGNGEGISLRVRRLLDHPADVGPTPHSASPCTPVCAAGALLLAVWLGAVYGDTLLTLLPGVGR